MSDIFEIKTSVGTMLVQAKTGSVAVGYARRGMTARKLTGTEVRALTADAVIHDADAEETTEGSGEGGTSAPQDPSTPEEPAGD